MSKCSDFDDCADCDCDLGCCPDLDDDAGCVSDEAFNDFVDGGTISE